MIIKVSRGSMMRFNLFFHSGLHAGSALSLKTSSRWFLLLISVNFLLQFDFAERLIDGSVAEAKVVTQSDICGELPSMGPEDSKVQLNALAWAGGVLAPSDFENTLGLVFKRPFVVLENMLALQGRHLAPQLPLYTLVFSGLSPPLV